MKASEGVRGTGHVQRARVWNSGGTQDIIRLSGVLKPDTRAWGGEFAQISEVGLPAPVLLPRAASLQARESQRIEAKTCRGGFEIVTLSTLGAGGGGEPGSSTER